MLEPFRIFSMLKFGRAPVLLLVDQLIAKVGNFMRLALAFLRFITLYLHRSFYKGVLIEWISGCSSPIPIAIGAKVEVAGPDEA